MRATLQAVKTDYEHLSRRLLQFQETQRQHLARELHDEIGQTLTVIKLNLQALRGKPGPGRPEPKLADTIRLVDDLLQQVRRLSLDLHPHQLDLLGLLPALRDHANQLARRAGWRCRFLGPETLPRLDPAIELACFRVAQEALTNVARHARASAVVVALLADAKGLRLKIRDDGLGFDYAAARGAAAREGKLGLIGMEERAALAGGQLICRSRPGRGTEIQAVFRWVPLQNS